MEPIGVISSAWTAISIAEKLSKYFLPPKAIKPRSGMEYIGGETLKHTVEFELPKVRRLSLRRKRGLDPALESLLGFVTIDLIVEGNPLSKSLSLNNLFDWHGLLRDKELGLKSGNVIELRISIPIDLNRFILHKRPVADAETLDSLNNHELNVLRIPVENTLSIPVRQYPIIMPLPSQNLNLVHIRKGPVGKEREDELQATLSFSTRLFSVHGNLKDEFPDIDTSQMDTWIKHDGADKERKITIPVDLEKKEKVMIILYFGKKGV